jgi:hypothetical protein
MSSQERNAVRDQVLAVIGLELARAERKAAEAFVKVENTVNHANNWSTRAQRERTHRMAKHTAEMWNDVYAVAAERLSDGMQTESESAEQPAPERTVAWLGYVVDGPNLLVCNRRVSCKSGYDNDRNTKWIPLKSADLPDGGVCQRCVTDVLA